MSSCSVCLPSMANPSTLQISSRNPLGSRLVARVSASHFNEQLVSRQHASSFPRVNCSTSSSKYVKVSSLKSAFFRTPVVGRIHVHCSLSNDNTSNSENPVWDTLKQLSFGSLKANLSKLTPLDVCKGSLAIAIVVAATKWTLNLLLNPFFWMYFSWTWLFWPWYVAVGIAGYGIYCFRKQYRQEANIFEQLAIVTSAFTWITLVPPAYFNGFLEGWPYVFFIVYHYFFFLNVSVRKRLYGDLYPRPHDPKWDISVPNWYSVLFGVGVVIGHWLAAFEGLELHRIPGGWNNVGIWMLIMITIFSQYNATLYLANYSEKVVEPTAVVQFGPFRWVRHPIYASTMLLFVTYFAALRAPFSCLFIVAVCTLYYDQKAKLEEALMVDTFGESYTEYMSKVRQPNPLDPLMLGGPERSGELHEAKCGRNTSMYLESLQEIEHLRSPRE